MLKRLMTIAALAVAVLLMCSCNQSLEKAIVGTWTTTLDISDVFADSLGGDMGVADFELECNFVLEFTENNKVEWSIDTTPMAEGFEGMMRQLKEYIVNKAYAETGMNREDADKFFMDNVGMTISDYADQQLSTLTLESLTATMQSTSIYDYSIKGDKLYLVDEDSTLDDAINSKDYIVIEIKDNQLTFVDVHGDNTLSDEYRKYFEFPMVFSKAA